MIIIVVLLFPKLQVVTTVVERESQPWRMKRYKQVDKNCITEANEKTTATDDKVECQKFDSDTFFNGAAICSNKGFRFPTPSNLNKMKTTDSYIN